MDFFENIYIEVHDYIMGTLSHINYGDFEYLDWSTFVVILISLIIIGSVVYMIIKWNKIRKLRNKITALYKEKVIGAFQDDYSYIESHKEVFQEELLNEQESIYRVKHIWISIVNCYIKTEGKWRADVGQIDTNAYYNALSSYEQAYNNWEINKAQWDNQENTKHKIAMDTNSFYSPKSFPVSRPSRPSESSYVVYYRREGYAESSEWLSHILGSDPGTITIDPSSYQELTFDFQKIFDKKIKKIYQNIFSQLGENIDDDKKDSLVLEYDDGYIKLCYEKQIQNGLLANATEQLGSYYKNVEVYSYQSECELNQCVYLPLIAVISSSNESNKQYLSLLDHIDPTIVIDQFSFKVK
jgi:hypothetical protein